MGVYQEMTIKNSRDNLQEDGNLADRFCNLVSEILELEALVQERKDEIKDRYIIAKAEGLNVKALKQVVREKQANRVEEREEYEAIVDEYRSLLGLIVC